MPCEPAVPRPALATWPIATTGPCSPLQGITAQPLQAMSTPSRRVEWEPLIPPAHFTWPPPIRGQLAIRLEVRRRLITQPGLLGTREDSIRTVLQARVPPGIFEV